MLSMKVTLVKRKISYNRLTRQHKKSLLKIRNGDVISLRILKLKENLGGFMSMEQMNDVWGLSPEVIGALNSHFKVYTYQLYIKLT
jgi:hypothetical protein